MDEEARKGGGSLWDSAEQGLSRAVLGGVDLASHGVETARAAGSIGHNTWNAGVDRAEQTVAGMVPRVLSPVSQVYDWIAD